jgi:phosphoribosyl 1,2-cyclic phosphate phosphodiesterase
MSNDRELLFLGTGTSAGIPMIGCNCAVCTSPDPHDKRTRTSVVVSYDSPATGQRIRVLVDTTPELRLQCVANDVQSIDAVVFTHGHADHVMGLDDCRRFNALRGGPLDVWADERTIPVLTRCFGYAFDEPAPDLKVFRPHLVHQLITGAFEIGGVTWTPVPLMHGDLPVLGFRVGRMAYCTDVSFIPQASYPLLEGLDVLVLDALQRKRHITHFSLEQALDEAKKIRARQTLFTHIAHGLGDAETNAELPDNVRLAYDGQRVTASGSDRR